MSAYSKEQAIAWLKTIRNLMNRLSDPDVITEITELPLEVSVRSDWTPIGDPLSPDEYRIILSTGGPEVRIHGYLRPITVSLEHRDWSEAFESLDVSGADERILLDFVGVFFDE